MAEKTVVISQQSTKPIKIIKWKVREGISVSIGSVVLLYDFDGVEKKQQLKLKSTYAGTVCKIVAQEGAIISSGEPLFELEACIHPTVMKDMCAECGADLRQDAINATASVPMVHAIPELKVSEELAQKLGKADGERLLRDKKLVLLVDLDQTLIHTTNDIIPPNIRDVYHFQLYGPNSPWYHTRLRPGTHQFLMNVSPYFELHICTFGARNYAHRITQILDGDERFFSNRVLSRDECFNPTSKTANLKALFPCGDHMVCIIDDREDVWSHASNLIHVKPYHFFKHTGDINAPPGLEKLENDDKECIDLSKIRTPKDSEKEQSEQNNHDNEVACDKNSETINNDYSIEETEKINSNGESDDSPKEVNGEEKSDSTTVDNKNQEPDKIESDEKKSVEQESTKNDNDVIDVEDPDDYLLYLEDILIRIHKAFYDEYDRLESGEVPDLKKVIPEEKSKVLQGCKMIFSGLVPTHIKLHHSRAYQVAKSLGAVVTPDLEDDTTHLVAVRPGTAKVNAGRRRKNLKIVTPDWLWACAERWEHVDENIFPLNSKGSKNRHPPPHCSSPEHAPNYNVHETPTQRKRSSSGRFIDTINPLMSFSTADIADMDKEVADTLDTESESEDDAAKANDEDNALIPAEEDVNTNSSSSSAESLTAEMPKGYKRNFQKLIEEDEVCTKESDDEIPSTKFRRGEQLDSDLDIGQESNSEGSVEAPDEIDDGEWNMMGAALEREFLSN